MPRDFSDFDIEDFATDEYFIKWVTTSDREVHSFWESYSKDHPQMVSKIEQARLLILGLQAADQPRQVDGKIARMWATIKAETYVAPVKQLSPRFSVVKIAATLLILLSAASALYVWNQFSASPISNLPLAQEGFVEEINSSGNIMHIHLSDGSIVSLENHSRLRYRANYEGVGTRDVFLKGEAFFDIAKDAQKPFFVYANEVVTKVLGTSFRVKAYGDSKNITVSVKEGHVSVFSAKALSGNENKTPLEINGVTLLPNQQAVYTRGEDVFQKTLVEKPDVVKPEIAKDNFRFSNTPIKEVFHVLEQLYGVEIIFDEETMDHCYLTAPLGNEPLFEKLNIICETIGASYELIDAQVVIASKGCIANSESTGF